MKEDTSEQGRFM